MRMERLDHKDITLNAYALFINMIFFKLTKINILHTAFFFKKEIRNII